MSHVPLTLHGSRSPILIEGKNYEASIFDVFKCLDAVKTVMFVPVSACILLICNGVA
jgi:hypothetical protein